ncbi:MAG: hypothetical protein AUK03_13465 [Anaerolineae bacterium CG2_30_64_16]|nr:MAG: hypothetical protein AUK03_13465 [Anaerolineae bacterium CG2_30_64_16]
MLDACLALALAGAAFAGYALTLAPGILGGDAGELQFVPHILSLAHPTGYPLQILLDRLWLTVIPFGSVAWRINLLSALVAALGVGIVFTVVRSMTASRVAGTIAAVALAIAPVYWGQAVLGDKYALNGLLTALWAWMAWRSYERPGGWTWAQVVLALGLGLAHHRSFLVFVVPTLLLAIESFRGACYRRGWLRPNLLLLAGGGALALPLLLYIYVPLASLRGLPPYHAKITNLREFIGFMNDAGYMGQVGFLPKGENLRMYAETLVANFGPPLVLTGLAGLITWWVLRPRQRRWLVFLGLSFVLQAYLTQNYDVPRRYVFFIPAYVCVALLVGAGVAGWLALAGHLGGRRAAWVQVSLAVVFLVLLMVRLPGQWRIRWLEQHVARPMDIWRQDLKTGGQADRLAMALALVPPRSLVVGDWEQATPLWYAQQVQGFCPDCRIQGDFYDLIKHAARATAENRPLYVARTLNQATDWSKPTAAGPLVHLASTPQTELPAGLVLLDVVFDGQVRLAGHTWPLGKPVLQRGQVLPLSLIWRLEQSTAPDYAIALRLVHAQRGEIWKTDNPAPVLGMYPFSRQAAGQVVADYYEIPLPWNAPAGAYQVEVALYRVLPGGGFINAKTADAAGRAIGEAATVLSFDLHP